MLELYKTKLLDYELGFMVKISKAISKINNAGVLLVFPDNNRKEPASLWSEFFPRQKMKWEWADDGDTRVLDMWSLMKRLSSRTDVVYSKWYKGRATFFSCEVLTAMLASRGTSTPEAFHLSPTARALLDALEMDSPLSTRELKLRTDLQGKMNEPLFQRGIKELFTQLLIVGHGEVDDGAFPSLAVGATRLIFENLWRASRELPENETQRKIDQAMPDGSAFRKFFERSRTIKRSFSDPS